jgi:hypothetical protein
MWVPIERWTLQQSTQRNTSLLTDAHSDCFILQSAQILFEGSSKRRFNLFLLCFLFIVLHFVNFILFQNMKIHKRLEPRAWYKIFLIFNLSELIPPFGYTWKKISSRSSRSKTSVFGCFLKVLQCF